MTIIVSVPWAEMERIAIPLQRTRQILAQQIHVVQMEFALQQVSVYVSTNQKNSFSHLFIFKANGYWCFCNDGENGLSCNNLERKAHVSSLCSEDACLNEGRCLPMNNSIICACKSNFYGPKCQYKLNRMIIKEKCVTNVCQNNGVCSLLNSRGRQQIYFNNERE